MDATERLRATLEAFNRRDFAAALEGLTPDVVWEPYLGRTEAAVLRGHEEVLAAWQSQMHAIDARGEMGEPIRLPDGQLVVPMRFSGRGSGSGMAVSASFAFLVSLDGAGRVSRAAAFDTVEEAVAAGRNGSTSG